MILSIVRRRKLGNGSTRAIKANLFNMEKEIDIYRYDSRGLEILRHKWINTNTIDSDYILRWGYTGECGFDREHTINLSEHIHLVNNKPECRKKLIEANISCPITFYNKADVDNCLILGSRKYVGRPSHHAQGRKFKFISSREDLTNDNTSDYWSEYIDKDREFRVFTFFGKILMVAEKIPTETGRRRIAWNHFGNGASFVNINWSEWPIEACKEALKASNVIGIDFAGVDVMVKDNIPYILEINSAHSLTSEYRQTVFSKAINWLISELPNGKPQHFEYPEHIRTYKSIILPYLRRTNER